MFLAWFEKISKYLYYWYFSCPWGCVRSVCGRSPRTRPVYWTSCPGREDYCYQDISQDCYTGQFFLKFYSIWKLLCYHINLRCMYVTLLCFLLSLCAIFIIACPPNCVHLVNKQMLTVVHRVFRTEWFVLHRVLSKSQLTHWNSSTN